MRVFSKNGKHYLTGRKREILAALAKTSGTPLKTFPATLEVYSGRSMPSEYDYANPWFILGLRISLPNGKFVMAMPDDLALSESIDFALRAEVQQTGGKP